MIDINDGLVIVGLGMLGAGLGMISVELALCVMGSLLTIGGLVGAWQKGRAGGSR